jgi:hypothetical protein
MVSVLLKTNMIGFGILNLLILIETVKMPRQFGGALLLLCFAEREGLAALIPGWGYQTKSNGAALRASFFIPVRFTGQARYASGNKKCPRLSSEAPLLFVCGL